MSGFEMAATGVPTRSFMDSNTKWRYGIKPIYTVVDNKYLEEKTRSHPTDSLEKLVENLVKSWEMEATHKELLEDWGTIDRDAFEMIVNGEKSFTAADLIQHGSYNALLATCPFYQQDKETFDISHKLFKRCFSKGFAWELLDLIGGPPKVSITWRHWAHFTGYYEKNAPTGELLEMYGSAVITVNDDIKIVKIELFYDPNPMIQALSKIAVCPRE